LWRIGIEPDAPGRLLVAANVGCLESRIFGMSLPQWVTGWGSYRESRFSGTSICGADSSSRLRAALADRDLKSASRLRRGDPRTKCFAPSTINSGRDQALRHRLECSQRCTTPDTTAESLEQDFWMFAKISQ
jgi:hypothetical protein